MLILKIKMRKVTAFICLLFASSFVFAEGEFDQFVRKTFEINFSELNKTQNTKLFLTAFSEDLKGSIVMVGLDGTTQRSEVTKELLANYVKKYDLPGPIYSTWKINDPNFDNNGLLRENTYAVFFAVEVDTWAGDSIISHAKNLVQIVAKKIDGNIKITYFSMTGVAQKVVVGDCYVHISNSEKNTFSVNMAYPAGREYKDLDYSIQISDGKVLREVVVDIGSTNPFYWNTNRKYVSTDRKQKIKIGKANSSDEVILLMMKNMHTDKCRTVIQL